MKNIIITIIGVLLLISLASAEVIKIEPKVLEPFSIYSGEFITQNITITTDGSYLVYLSWDVEGNSSDMEGFSVDYDSPIQVNKEREVQITLSAAYNYYPDSFTIHLYATTEVDEPAVIYRGGGSSTKYVDKIIEIPNYIDRELIKEIEVIKEVPGETEIIKEKSIWKWVSLIFFILIVLFVINKITKRNKTLDYEEELQEENENEYI